MAGTALNSTSEIESKYFRILLRYQVRKYGITGGKVYAKPGMRAARGLHVGMAGAFLCKKRSWALPHTLSYFFAGAALDSKSEIEPKYIRMLKCGKVYAKPGMRA